MTPCVDRGRFAMFDPLTEIPLSHPLQVEQLLQKERLKAAQKQQGVDSPEAVAQVGR